MGLKHLLAEALALSLECLQETPGHLLTYFK